MFKKLLSSLLISYIVLSAATVALAADTVTVNFDPNGGTVATNLLTTESSKSLPDENTPTKAGSDFIGWTYDPDADYTIKLTEIKPTSDITLYAKWNNDKSNTYTVVLDANEGVYTYSPRAYVYNRIGTTMDEPTEPTREGYTFKGWTNEKGSSSLVDLNNVSKEGTYYAVWSDGSTESKDTVTVTFDSAGGSSIEPKEIEKGSKLEEPTPPEYAGKRFLGWFLDGEEFDFSISVRQDINLVAHWENITSKSFDVTLVAGDENGGSTFSDGAYVHTVNLSDLLQINNQETPIPTRYKSFNSWSLAKTQDWGTSGLQLINPALVINDNMTVYATYKDEDNSATIAEVRFDANGGNWKNQQTGENYDIKKVSVKKNTKVTKPETPTNKNRAFKGWYATDEEEPDEEDKWNFNDTVVEDITLYAYWEDEADDEEEEINTTVDPVAATQQPENFPNPENLPVVEPINTAGDSGALSIKDIPTTGIELNLTAQIVLVISLLLLLVIVVKMRSKHEKKI